MTLQKHTWLPGTPMYTKKAFWKTIIGWPSHPKKGTLAFDPQAVPNVLRMSSATTCCTLPAPASVKRKDWEALGRSCGSSCSEGGGSSNGWNTCAHLILLPYIIWVNNSPESKGNISEHHLSWQALKLVKSLKRSKEGWLQSRWSGFSLLMDPWC